MDTLVSDTLHLLSALYTPHTTSSSLLNTTSPNNKLPPFLLVGHSLGGVLAVNLATSKKLTVAGLIVLDLVEGSALHSLQHMNTTLENRPAKFCTPQDAIQWRYVEQVIHACECLAGLSAAQLSSMCSFDD